MCDLDESKCNTFASELPAKSIGAFVDITKKESVIALKDKILNEYNSDRYTC